MSLHEFALHGNRAPTIDGHPILATAATIDVRGMDPAQVTLQLVVVRPEFSGRARVMLDDSTREVLVAMGWTPPPGVPTP